MRWGEDPRRVRALDLLEELERQERRLAGRLVDVPAGPVPIAAQAGLPRNVVPARRRRSSPVFTRPGASSTAYKKGDPAGKEHHPDDGHDDAQRPERAVKDATVLSRLTQAAGGHADRRPACGVVARIDAGEEGSPQGQAPPQDPEGHEEAPSHHLGNGNAPKVTQADLAAAWRAVGTTDEVVAFVTVGRYWWTRALVGRARHAAPPEL